MILSLISVLSGSELNCRASASKRATCGIWLACLLDSSYLRCFWHVQQGQRLVSRLSRAGGGGQGQGGGQMTLKRGNGFTIFSYGPFKCGLSRIYGHKLKGDTLVCFLPYWRFKKTSSAFWEMSPSLLIPLQWSHATCFQSKISWQSPGYNLIQQTVASVMSGF